MSRIYMPTTDMSDWRRLLTDPDKHWRAGYSAMSIAKSWQEADGFPPRIASTLAHAEEPIRSLVPLIILPEHSVGLPGGSASSKSDVWVLASHAKGLASIAVEGKVSEDFGETVAKWLVNASQGKLKRLDFLQQLLGLPATMPHTIRYQLLHRVASSIWEAQRFRANVALCVIQSFSVSAEGSADDHFADFEAFCGLFSKTVRPGEVVALGQHADIPFFAVWVRDTLL